MKPLQQTIYPVVLCVCMLISACFDHGQPDSDIQVSRTILVYMVANNSLGSPGQGYRDNADIDEMIEAAKVSGFNGGRVLVYHHGYKSKSPTLEEVTPDGTVVLCTYDNSASSITSARMRKVLNDTRQKAPADEFGLILWSHGTGWIENGMEDEPLAFSFGEDREWITDYRYNPMAMNVTTLADVIGNDRPFKFIYFDCCYMGGIEVAYELRNTTDMIVASATELPVDGMPYDRNLPVLMGPEADVVQAAANTFDHYNALSGGNRTCTMSVIDCRALDELADVSQQIYASTTPLESLAGLQAFKTNEPCYYYDLEDYIERLAPPLPLLDKWREVLAKAVMYKANTPQLWGRMDIDRHCGLSTYPLLDKTASATQGYNKFEWYTDAASAMFNTTDK